MMIASSRSYRDDAAAPRDKLHMTTEIDASSALTKLGMYQ